MKFVLFHIFQRRNSFIFPCVSGNPGISDPSLLYPFRHGTTNGNATSVAWIEVQIGSHDEITFKSHILKCGSVFSRVRTITVFVKVMIISDGQSFSKICMVYFPFFFFFKGFLSNQTGNRVSKEFLLKPDKTFLFSDFLIPSFSFALTRHQNHKMGKWISH